jgi:hypothetical protein
MIVNPVKFVLGLVGLVIFAGVLVIWFSPVFHGQTGLALADRYFNRLAKQTASFCPDLAKEASKYQGKSFDVTFEAESPEEAAQIGSVMTAHGAAASVSGKSVHLTGDLGRVGASVIADAYELFQNRERAVCGCAASCRESVLCSWLAFAPIYKSYIAAVDVPASNFASSVLTKACEPAYNYYGIEPLRASQSMIPLSSLLVFYVIYTVWYGFSIMFLFEGMGITARRQTRTSS